MARCLQIRYLDRYLDIPSPVPFFLLLITKRHSVTDLSNDIERALVENFRIRQLYLVWRHSARLAILRVLQSMDKGEWRLRLHSLMAVKLALMFMALSK